MDQTLFGRGSALRPPQAPRIWPETVLLPNNLNLEAGICTYCRKKVLHFGPPEGLRAYVSNTLLRLKLVICDALFFYNYWGRGSDICRSAFEIEHPCGGFVSLAAPGGPQTQRPVGTGMNGSRSPHKTLFILVPNGRGLCKPSKADREVKPLQGCSASTVVWHISEL